MLVSTDKRNTPSLNIGVFFDLEYRTRFLKTLEMGEKFQI